MKSRIGIAGIAVLVALAGLPLQAKSPAAVEPQERLLVLPVKFTYFKYGVGESPTVVAEKSEAAERNLEGSLDRALKREQATQFIALPELNADEQKSLREHVDLLRLAVIGALSQRRLDYSIGDGLAFLADRTGVDNAIFVSGSRGEPAGSVAILTLFSMLGNGFLVGGGNQKELSAVVLNLRSGKVLMVYLPERGFAGEADDVAGANTWMHALFDIIPPPPRAELKTYRVRAPEKPVPHPRPRRGFTVLSPGGWFDSESAHLMCFSLRMAALERICIDDKSFETTEADSMKAGAIAVSLLKADPRYADMEVTSLLPARVAGRDGFRVELTSLLNLSRSHVRERHVVYGVVGSDRAYLLRFDAPAIYYFEHHLADFEAVVPTFKFLQ
ncbi:MAG TPA: hypothetical protein VGO61_08150 [Steroidobacteraceae bacterium]|jgi:hypothetical protein|nr:hypothetical protein [Steroidobacteraceae bacterium]